jgi:hypothetical protein
MVIERIVEPGTVAGSCRRARLQDGGVTNL